MNIHVSENKVELSRAAAKEAAALIRETVSRRGVANLIAATGASQLDFLDALVRAPGIDWAKTCFFHLDEYIGLPESHPASFRRYLRERIIDRVHPGTFHLVNGGHPDPSEECRRLGKLIRPTQIDLAFVGIGENGHLAFNDPPADFETEEPYLVVSLDEACRRQQWREGWFGSLEEVPRRAITLSVRQILKARTIFCLVPDERKAKAAQECLEGEISPLHPASILRRHPDTRFFLDRAATSRLETVLQ